MAIRLAGQRFEYILEDDRESDVPTVFGIRELTHIERSSIRGMMPQSGVTEVPDDVENWEPTPEETQALETAEKAMTTAFRNICDMGIESAAPVFDAQGKVTILPIGELLANMKHPDHIRELAIAVIECNTVSDSDKKK